MLEADMGMTSMAMRGNQGRYQGDENLLVRFYLDKKQMKTESIAQGRPIYKDVPWVHIMQPGNKESIIHRVATQMDKDRFAEHYRKFEARESQEVTEGTPLIKWPAITRAQAEELKFYNVITVEQLAGMSDTNTQNFRGMGQLKAQANTFLAEANKGATQAQLADANETIAALTARLDAMEAAPPKAKKRKRRSPAEMEAAKEAAKLELETPEE